MPQPADIRRAAERAGVALRETVVMGDRVLVLNESGDLLQWSTRHRRFIRLEMVTQLPSVRSFGAELRRAAVKAREARRQGEANERNI